MPIRQSWGSVLLLAMVLPMCEVAAQSPNIDFSGVHAFWRVTEELQRDKDPSPLAWDSLFATRGYGALEARERRRQALTTAFRAAFMPSRRAERDSILVANGWTARLIRHVAPLPASRAVLDEYEATFARDNVMRAAVQRTMTLFPPATPELFGQPPVAFVFFLPDGRGYPGLIVADLEHARNKDPIPFFAHEASHFYYARYAALRAGRNAPTIARDGITALMDLLTKLHEESVGDQFDKINAVTLSRATLRVAYPRDSTWQSYLNAYRDEFDSATIRIAALDRLLADGSSLPEVLLKSSDSLGRALPLEGRPLGMYITQAIRRVHGDRMLAQVAGDPIAWMDLYARAAARTACECPRLSNDAVRMLRMLRDAGR